MITNFFRAHLVGVVSGNSQAHGSIISLSVLAFLALRGNIAAIERARVEREWALLELCLQAFAFDSHWFPFAVRISE